MVKRRVALILATAMVALVSLGGAVQGLAGGGQAAALPKATISMNWFPEPEQGGFYAAVQQGLYKKNGANITIQTFNPQQGCEPLVATGRVTFCMDNADTLLLARQQGIPVVGVMTTFQINPQCILWHAEDKTMHGVADLSNHTFIYSFGATGYWEYMKHKYHYTNVKEQNTDYTLRAFFANPKAVNQCYVTSEPYTAMHMGYKVKWALIADSGYNPYGQVMMASEQEITAHPDVVRAFVRGSIAGWKAYVARPEPVFAYLHSVPGATGYPLTTAAMRFSFSQLKPLVLGGAAKTHGLGYTDGAGLARLRKQMMSVGLKVDKADPSKAYTNAFLPSAGM